MINDFLFRGTTNGIPGITLPSTVLPPIGGSLPPIGPIIPQKKVIKVEGVSRNQFFLNQVGVANFFTTVLNEVYVLNIGLTVALDDQTNKQQNLAFYTLGFPPTVGQTMSLFPLYNTQPLAPFVSTQQYFNILCSSLALSFNVGATERIEITITGYKLFLQDL